MRTQFPIWKESPFIRILIPFASGIFLQSIFNVSNNFLLISIAVCLLALLLFQSLSASLRLKYSAVTGTAINISIILLAALAFSERNISRHPNCINKYNTRNSIICIQLEEPPLEKPKSWKAVASILTISTNDSTIFPSGKIIVYFQKQDFSPLIQYGSRIIFQKELQEIINPPNAKTFDYKQWCERQNIFRQVYLKHNEYFPLQKNGGNLLDEFLIEVRNHITSTLSKFIPNKRESGFAEALLIGYKNDLDPSLTQSYSNTGVIHIIAISGLHLGIIYLLLSLFLKPISSRYKWTSAFLIIALLWTFSLLAGGGPSVLRSTIMFSFIVIGKTISRNSSVYNNLAASAFILLCINPSWLWDVGFQLSYLAVLSIVIFYKRIYCVIHLENKILDAIWKLNSLTISAQILTLPICLYHFQQFPTYFLFANLPAIPISSLILLAEIFLCMISFIPAIASLLGFTIAWTIRFLNSIIEHIDSLPYSTIKHLGINEAELVTIYILIASISHWLNKKVAQNQAF